MLKELEIKASEAVSVGDVFASSWGYDQTNVDFYQVLKVSDKAVMIQEIESETVEKCGDMSEYVRPILGKFKANSKPFRRLVKMWSDQDVYIKIASYEYAHKTDPNKKHLETSYA